MTQNRRGFLKKSVVAGAAAGTLGFPMVAKAQSKFQWKMTTAWPAGTPFYQSGPGSAEAFAKRVDDMSNWRLTIKVFAAGEILPAAEGFDACSAGEVEMTRSGRDDWGGHAFASQ